MAKSEKAPRRSGRRSGARSTLGSPRRRPRPGFQLPRRPARGARRIASAEHEGWTCSDATTTAVSPAPTWSDRLERLLDDVEAGKVDCVVVYKVDRLTRSLPTLPRSWRSSTTHGVSFVRSRSSSTPRRRMGRLTLNMLLSFAQFEREIIGERIRDKIAASKKKGMWMGGIPPLGYDVKDRKLVVNDGRGPHRGRTSSGAILRSSRFATSRRSLRPGIRSKRRLRPDGTVYGQWPDSPAGHSI